MTETDVMVSLDAAPLDKTKAEGLNMNATPDGAVRHRLDSAQAEKTQIQDRRWAEENALLVEALAGGAAEVE